MATEIERKYLVCDDGWRSAACAGVRYRQGYLAKTRFSTVRVRAGGGFASLTIKGARQGISREEFTYPIPLDEAEFMLRNLCGKRVLEKVRHLVEHDGMTWCVDVYKGSAQGLMVAEIELDRHDQPFSVPWWAGSEITHDPHYRNSVIALWQTAHRAKENMYEQEDFRPEADRRRQAG